MRRCVVAAMAMILLAAPTMEMKEEKVGIGVTLALTTKNGAVVISSIVKGGGADKTGGKIQVNDEIVEIDGKPVEQKIEAVQQELHGARGSEIKLRLKRYGSQV
jgi:C-terminal processing protease CtpA/Prc